MQHAITVGKGFGKKDFTDAVLNAKANDVIVIEPGEYYTTDRFGLISTTWRGAGASPSDVIIHVSFYVMDSHTVKLENLTLVNDVTQSNVAFSGQGTQVIANRVIFQSRIENYPAIGSKGGSISLTASEVRANESGSFAMMISEGANALISQSDISGLAVDGSKAELRKSQVREKLTISNHSGVIADTLYIADTLPDFYSLRVLSGSEFSAEWLVIPEGQTYFEVLDSRVVVVQNNLDPAHLARVDVNDNYEINMPNASVYQKKAQTEGGSDSEDYDEGDDSQPTEDNGDTETEAAEESNEPAAQDEKPAIDQLHEMIGLEKLKEQVDTFIKVALFNKRRASQGLRTTAQSLHSLFLGNPGTGKTTVARLVAKVMFENGVMPNDNYVEVSRQDLVSNHVGETAIQTQRILESALGGVLFIDEAYTLYQDGGGTNWGQEAVDTILKFMEDHRDDLMIIFAGYTKEMKDFMNMNPGLTSRAPYVFTFEDYTADEIAEIGTIGLKKQDYRFNEALYADIVKKAFKSDVDHGNGRWVRNFNDQLIQNFVMSLPLDAEDLLTIPDSVITDMVGGDQDDKDLEVEKLLAELNGMIGLTSVKRFVNQLVERIRIERALEDKLPEDNKQTYHMIFSGAPGTGKTTVARIIAKLFYNLGILPKDTVSEVARPDLVGRYIGETEVKTSTAIRNAMGGVLFVDEAYQLTKEGSSNDFGKEAVETFITELENNRDKFVAIFAGYTADMERFLDANSGLRSRIPLTLEFEDYTPEEVAEIVYAIVSKNWKVDESFLKQSVTFAYRALPDNEKSNGRWARNYADQLIAKHKLWLGQHLNDPEIDERQISNELFAQM